MDYLWLTTCDLNHEPKLDLFDTKHGWFEACNLYQRHFDINCPFETLHRLYTASSDPIAIPAHFAFVPHEYSKKQEWVKLNSYVIQHSAIHANSATPNVMQRYAKHNTYILRPDYVQRTPEEWMKTSLDHELYVYDTTMKCIPASILQYKDGHFLITYVGCSSVWDEWIPCDSYRFCYFPVPLRNRSRFSIDLLWWRSVLGNAMTCHHVFQHVSAYIVFECGFKIIDDEWVIAFKVLDKLFEYIKNKFKDHSCQKDIIV
jgi:hypothetical protein